MLLPFLIRRYKFIINLNFFTAKFNPFLKCYCNSFFLTFALKKYVFIATGTNDPICSSLESEELQALLEKENVNVAMRWENRGHQLTASEVEAAAQWYRTFLNA